MTRHIILIAVLTVLISSAAVYGFISAGSPFELRGIKFDQTRISKLQLLSTAVDGYVMKQQKLPQNLEDIFRDSNNTSGYSREYYKDPETNQDFEYNPKEKYSYELCANFSADSPEKNPSVYQNSYQDRFGEYKKGRYCFNLTVRGYENFTQIPNNIPNSLLNAPASPTTQPTPKPEEILQDGITNITKEGIPYFIIVGSYKGVKSQYEITVSTKDKFGDALEVTVINGQNREANTIDKQDKPLKLEQFVVGDRIKVEANVKRGESYDANTIQNLTR